MPRKIFVIDDADFMVDMLRLILYDAGHKVVGTALSGPQALESIKKLDSASLPEIVTVDFHMPKMDGMETISRIRSLIPRIKILLVSAHATLPIVLKAKEVGVDGFIAKPFEPRAVLDAIDKLI